MVHVQGLPLIFKNKQKYKKKLEKGSCSSPLFELKFFFPSPEN